MKTLVKSYLESLVSVVGKIYFVEYLHALEPYRLDLEYVGRIFAIAPFGCFAKSHETILSYGAFHGLKKLDNLPMHTLATAHYSRC